MELLSNIKYPDSKSSHCLLILSQRYDVYSIIKIPKNQQLLIHSLEVRTDRTLQRLFHIIMYINYYIRVCIKNGNEYNEYNVNDWKKTDLKRVLGTLKCEQYNNYI